MTKTATLQTALKLKEAGWVKETEYYWVPCGIEGVLKHSSDIKFGFKNRIPAPGTELLEELPKEIVKDGDKYILTIVITNTRCYISYIYQYLQLTMRLHPVSGDNIFEALAELWMELNAKTGNK